MSRDGGARSARTDRRSWSRSMPSMFDSHPTTSSPLAPSASNLMITSRSFSSKAFWDSFRPRSLRNRSAGASWPIVARRFVSEVRLRLSVDRSSTGTTRCSSSPMRRFATVLRLQGAMVRQRCVRLLGLLGLVPTTTARAPAKRVLHRRPAASICRYATYGGQPVRTAA